MCLFALRLALLSSLYTLYGLRSCLPSRKHAHSPSPRPPASVADPQENPARPSQLERSAFAAPPRRAPASRLLRRIREYDAKLLVAYHLGRAPTVGTKAAARESFQSTPVKVAQVSPDLPLSSSPRVLSSGRTLHSLCYEARRLLHGRGGPCVRWGAREAPRRSPVGQARASTQPREERPAGQSARIGRSISHPTMNLNVPKDRNERHSAPTRVLPLPGPFPPSLTSLQLTHFREMQRLTPIDTIP